MQVSLNLRWTHQKFGNSSVIVYHPFANLSCPLIHGDDCPSCRNQESIRFFMSPFRSMIPRFLNLLSTFKNNCAVVNASPAAVC